MASTTSTEQSGLFAHLLPAFKSASGIDVRARPQNHYLSPELKIDLPDGQRLLDAGGLKFDAGERAALEDEVEQQDATIGIDEDEA